MPSRWSCVAVPYTGRALPGAALCDVGIYSYSHLRIKDIHAAEEFVSHGFDDVHNADLCAVRLSVMAATRCAVVVFGRVQCIPIQTSSGVRVAGMVAEWFSYMNGSSSLSPSQRTFRISLKRSSSAKCGGRSGSGSCRRCPASNVSSREFLTNTRESGVHMYHFEDALAIATNRDYTTSSVRQRSHEDEKKKLRDEIVPLVMLALPRSHLH